MLAFKKINKNKLIINFVVIIIMLLGTAFLIYKDYTLISRDAEFTEVAPAEFDKPLADNIPSVPVLSNQASGSAAAGTAAGEKGTGLNKIINKELDISIFSKDFFRALKDNTISESQKIETGRRNPFEPY